MSKNFINFSILTSSSSSCQNSDDMGMQKSAIFGGKRRTRISSQSLKSSMRHSEYYKQHLGTPSTRTRNLDVLKEKLTEKFADKFSDETINKAIVLWSDESKLAKQNKTEDSKSDDATEDTSSKKVAVAAWIEAEIEELANLIENNDELKAILNKIEDTNKITVKKDFEKAVKEDRKELKKIITKLQNSDVWKAITQASSQAKDIALSGRMATSGLMTNIDGALAVAHAITTHEVSSDIDWFTAVDDLQEQGSGHLDTKEFSAGVFYRYASLNIRQLQKNLGDASRAEALEIAAHVLHMLATVVPSAKQQSFAAYNLAEFALVSFSDQPISLANAFEKPVTAKRDGFLQPSIAKINEHYNKLIDAYDLDDSTAQFALDNSDNLSANIKFKGKLSELKAWVCNDGKE
jgi:CRISPR system Cascade subunit CasC